MEKVSLAFVHTLIIVEKQDGYILSFNERSDDNNGGDGRRPGDDNYGIACYSLAKEMDIKRSGLSLVEEIHIFTAF